MHVAPSCKKFCHPSVNFFFTRGARDTTVTLLPRRAPAPSKYGARRTFSAVTILRSDAMPNSFKERLHKGYAQSMELSGKPIVEEKSQFQRIKIFDSVANGRVMVLDDIVQITTRDESAYAEMLTHLPLLEHGKPSAGDDRGRRRPLHRRRGAEAQRREGGRSGRHRRPGGGALPRTFRRDQRQGVQGQAAENRDRRRLRISRKARKPKAAST